MIVRCPECNEIQYSIADKKYVELFKTCWSCDKKRWMNKELSLEEFERKEKEAVQAGGDSLR